MKQKISILFFFVVSLNYSNFAIVWGDYNCKLYPLECGQSKIAASGLSTDTIGIGDLLHQAGLYMTNANYQYKAFIYSIEENMYSTDKIQEYLTILKSCQQSLISAEAIYKKISLLNITLSPDIISKLKSINYYELALGKNSEMFTTVRNFMKIGDIKSIYNKYDSDSLNLLRNLNAIYNEMIYGIQPSIQEIYDLTDAFIDAERFGMYTSIILNRL